MIETLFLMIWGCIPELSPSCPDMTNASSTYLGILIGALIGIAISWWIYYRQSKTSVKQDEMLNKISELEQLHNSILKQIESIDKQHEKMLQTILNIDKKVEEKILSLDK